MANSLRSEPVLRWEDADRICLPACRYDQIASVRISVNDTGSLWDSAETRAERRTIPCGNAHSSEVNMTQTSSNTRNSSRSSSSRSGGRRRTGGNNRSSSGRPRSSASRKPQKKQGFFAKLLSTFGLGGDSNKGTGRPKSVKRVSGAQKSSGSSGERRQKTSRTPEIVPVQSPRLYLGNLSYDATESDLNELFSGVGTVQDVEIITHRRTQRSKGYAFLEMTTVEEAERAVQNLHDQEFMGRKLVVSGAKDRESSRDDD